MNCYKIKNADGLYSKGGWNGFSTRGKTWSSKQAVSSHLSYVFGNPNEIPDELILIELNETGVTEYNAKEWKLNQIANQNKKPKREDYSEEFESVYHRIKQEGFHYCFVHYSRFDEIRDETFHKLRNQYLDSAKKLEDYIKTKFNY